MAETNTGDLRQPLQRETVASIGYRAVVSVPVGATVRRAVAVMQEHLVALQVVTPLLAAPICALIPHRKSVHALTLLVTTLTFGIAVLLVANHLIDFAGDDGATGTVWTHGFVDDHGEGFIQQLIRYDDRYIRLDGGWYFTRRRHALWLGWRHGDPDPLAQQPAEWPARQVGIGSLPHDDPRWQSFWSRHS